MNTTEMKEVVDIRNAYTEKEASKTQQIRALDKKVRRPAQIFTFTFGIASALVFGTGMCLAMKVIGASLSPVLGIAVGVVGMALCGVNYPIYKAMLKKRKAKYANEILRMCDDAIGDNA